MFMELLGGATLAAAGVMAYGVRGRSAQLFGRSVWRGRRDRPWIALTFDDGPSESTPELLRVLEQSRARATFFQCGVNVRRLPEIARAVRQAGHEIGNHSDRHAPFYFRTGRYMYGELMRAQEAIGEATGSRPALFRAPGGVRWPGLGGVQRRAGLLGVMWTVIGRDWVLPAAGVAGRMLQRASNGAILCLHDGRELRPKPNIRETLEAVRRVVPELQARGFRFQTVSELLCSKN
jgi:peptidoglycan/xylan/chitin deacetylase (PgdA/CDA1 family)